MNPPFSLGCAQRKRAVHGPKERRFVSKSCPFGQVWTSTGVVRVGVPVIGRSPAGCDLALGNREGASPHLPVRCGFRGGHRIWRTSGPALSASLSAARFEVGRAAAERDAGQVGLAPRLRNSRSRAARLQVSAKPNPRPTLTLPIPGWGIQRGGPQPRPFESLGGVGASRNAPTFLEGVAGGGVFAPKTSPPSPRLGGGHRTTIRSGNLR